MEVYKRRGGPAPQRRRGEIGRAIRSPKLAKELAERWSDRASEEPALELPSAEKRFSSYRVLKGAERQIGRV